MSNEKVQCSDVYCIWGSVISMFTVCGGIIYANPSKFYILSLGFPDIEMKQGFVIGVYLLYSYGVSFTGVQEGILAGLHDLFSLAPRSIAKVGRWPGYSPCFLGEYRHVVVLG